MDIVLGVSMAPGTVRLVAIEGQNADGVTVEQEEFAVGAAENSANSAADQVIDAIIGTREGVFEGGHRLTSTGVTWTDPTGAAALRDAIASHELGNVMLVSPLLAAAALAQTVGYALGYGHIGMLFVEPRSATLAVVDVSDGSIVDLHRHQIPHGPGAPVAAELAAMVAGLDARDTRADGVFVVGCGTDIVAVKPALEAASPVPVTGPEEPDMALARGAALASANAPLFASSTAALAYALDPGTGEMDPPAFNPTYLDVWGDTGAPPATGDDVPALPVRHGADPDHPAGAAAGPIAPGTPGRPGAHWQVRHERQGGRVGEQGGFGFYPDEFDRMIREGSEGLREVFERVSKFVAAPGARTGWSSLFEDLSRRGRPAPETAGEAGDGVWAIYTVDAGGGAHVEQVFATELDALRANKDNVDPKRKVRFLPYGIAVSVLDDDPEQPG
ncbi:hypothetical protein PICSAR213_03946 [Mycobacterium avium subsp. paratuberculosis]|nr:hypothetical protein PICSAR213_03946 [Mycobacterium avium subsp. paratuberculosis]